MINNYQITKVSLKIVYSNLNLVWTIKGQHAGGVMGVRQLESKLTLKTGGQILIDFMNTLGVDSFSDIEGTYVRVSIEDGITRKVGHIIDDKWFDTRDYWRNDS